MRARSAAGAGEGRQLQPPLATRAGAPSQPGLALIQPGHCLTYQQQVCTSCLERCPEPGAIKLDGLHPRVIPDACTGCGTCHEICPAPVNAIIMLPKAGGRR